MSTPMLSVLIPARNEEWLVQTVEDLLKNIEADTEILVGLDGYWQEGLPDHDRVRVIHYPESIGQRAMQNRLAQISTAKYVMKLDAHCAVDKGFDRKMLEAFAETGDNVTMVPLMHNLHVFDWVCDNCGMRTYQGPALDSCRNEICDTATDGGDSTNLGHHKELVWQRKPGVRSSAYRFNKNLQFKYFPELRAKLPHRGLQESLSLQGSCFMATRERYFALPLCDETWGSWGQQGSEVALKTWLSGGQVLCNLDTWYAHLFRTQQGFSWPYELSGASQDRARKICRELFLNDKWDKAVRPLSWLLDKFWFALQDVQDQEARWTRADIDGLKGVPTRAMIYTTHNQLNLKVAHKVQSQLRRISEAYGIPIISVSHKPMDRMGKNIVFKGERGYMSMFKQLLLGLENTDADIVYITEHDVLYHPTHFDLTPPSADKFYFNQNWWRVRKDSDIAVHWDADQMSGLVCYRQLLIDWLKNKIKTIEEKGFDRSYEPQENLAVLNSAEPNIDIRGEWNQTKSKWSLDDFRDKSTAKSFTETTIASIPGWEYDNLRIT